MLSSDVYVDSKGHLLLLYQSFHLYQRRELPLQVCDWTRRPRFWPVLLGDSTVEMSPLPNIEWHIRNAAPTDPVPNANSTPPASSSSSSRRPPRWVRLALTPISVLVAVEWILFIAAIKVNERLNDEYFQYKNAGPDRPVYVDYPPFVTQGRDAVGGAVLITWLVPLAYDTFFVPTTFIWACYDGHCTVGILCVSIFAFPMWIICGSINTLTHLSARESTWNPSFNSLFGFATALQILLGTVWSFVMIAAARKVNNERKEKWMTEGVARALRRPEEHHMQDLPPYQA